MMVADGTSRRRLVRLGGAALLLAGLAGAVYAWTRRPLAVETAGVRRGTLAHTVVTSGQVAAPRQTTLGPEIGGRVVSVAVDEGAHVDEGELLAQLDDANAQAGVDEARAAVGEAEARLARMRRTGVRVALAAEARAQAEAEHAEVRLRRVEALVARGALPTDQLDEARRRHETATAQLAQATAEAESASAGGSDLRLAVAGLRRAQAALRAAERRLEQTRVRAPASGTILRRMAEQGAVVQAGQALFEFVADGAPRLEVHLDERHLAFVRAGQAALASVEARPDLTFGATVRRVAPSVDAARGTVKVELDIDDEVPFDLLPGMTASVEITLARLEDVLIIPAEAVRDASLSTPWTLVIEGGRLARRDLELGLRAGDLYELRSGLREGERVVLAAVDAPEDELREGTRVRDVEGR